MANFDSFRVMRFDTVLAESSTVTLLVPSRLNCAVICMRNKQCMAMVVLANKGKFVCQFAGKKARCLEKKDVIMKEGGRLYEKKVSRS